MTKKTAAGDATVLPLEFGERLVAWQKRHGRHELPWQKTRDPYRVWLSEIMLQQTQVTTVLGYYQRFLERFPTVADLGAASLDEVLSLWAGLGYYSRARNLHACARAVAARPDGSFPPTAAELQELPGIGRSTAAAIAAFCFGERIAILDGNVKRVLGRLLAFQGDLASSAQEKLLWQHAQALLPAEGIEAYTQGLMDLGATVCTPRSPQCLICPAETLCAGRKTGEPTQFPIKTRKLKRSRRENWWLWLEHEGQVLLQQRPDTGVWAGLWSLPLFEDEAQLQSHAQSLGATPDVLPRIEHALTHLDWVLHPRRAVLGAEAAQRAGQQGQWVAREALASYGLPAPLKKLLG
ncbi:A/G-specific adenine glycosylase [Paucibacter sp. B51]|uniref:A/G-specific adenine glycosylase n=1 Tax=Paucibacter sp. B51 TaxID=2993315 RepID=UPI0022EBB84B|nr:A/G-specific adenine glycosylase [Paucibacter sp. B51]